MGGINPYIKPADAEPPEKYRITFFPDKELEINPESCLTVNASRQYSDLPTPPESN